MSKRFARQEKSQPKHSHYSSAQPITRNNVVIPSNPSTRPEWRGPGYQKPKKKAAQKPWAEKQKEDLEIKNCLAEKLQRDFLTVVKNAFPICQREYEELKPLLTDVRLALDAGGDAFAKRMRGEENREMRETFVVRWGVERALLLANLIGGWAEGEFEEEKVFTDLRERTSSFLCFGTGMAELGALALLLSRKPGKDETVKEEASIPPPSTDSSHEEPMQQADAVQLSFYGSADWTTETDALLQGLEAPPILSKYASAAARAAASPFLTPDSLKVHMPSALEALDFSSLEPHTSLIIFSFTLQNMRDSSLPNTVKTLVALTRDAPKDSLLLVVDDVETPEALIENKRYPLRFVLDLALLGKGARGGMQSEEKGTNEGEGQKAGVSAAWEKLVSHEERTFKPERCGEYSISLGKVAVQVHLFKKI